MKRRVFGLCLFLLLGPIFNVLLPLTGCTTQSQPPWPPALTSNSYVPPTEERELPPDSLFYSVAGLRAAEHGLYLDLFVQSGADPSSLQGLSAVIAQAISVGSEPRRWIEIRDANREEVELRPLRYPTPGFGETVKWAAPGNVVVKQEDHRTIVVQTFLFRTPSQCTGRTYTVHLTDHWNEILSDDAPFHIIAASEWRQVPLNTQAEAPR